MDFKNLTSVDLVSYTGLAMVVATMIEVGKLLYRKWVDGKEPILSLGLTLVLGPVTKLTVPHAYENVPWVIFLVTLIGLQVPLNKLLHDGVLQPFTDAAKATPPPALVKTLGVMVALTLFLGGCCSVEKEGVDSLGRTQDLINVEFMKYIQDDTYKPKLDAKKKDDWAKLVQSEKDLRGGLLKNSK